MLDTIGRWLSRPAAKAETGWGVYPMSVYPQLTSLATHPTSLIAEAQALFHANPWVAQAERAIYGRYVRAAWHLEDSAGNTLDERAGGPARAALDLIQNPGGSMSRRRLWSITLRHVGLTGNAFWYLDQRGALGGVPLQTLYINPARMTPVESENGSLRGWIMDAADNPVSRKRNLLRPVPFELGELRHFVLDDPDWGHYGIGIVKAAYDQIRLEELATRHASGVLSSGGRMAGLISPKAGVTVNDEQWAGMLRDWRNIASDPDAAKRLLVVKGPVDFTDTAAKPSELQMSELMTLGRDNVFAAWGVPVSQVGVMTARGLNSGETVKYEEAALWQGAIEFRASNFEEQVQSVLDLFGLGLRLVVETPAFDDQAPLYDNATKAKVIPLTNNERRAAVGLDPLEDEELGRAVFIDQTMVRIDEEPEPVLPFTPSPSSDEDTEPEESGLGEAAQPVKARLRDLHEPKLREALQAFLTRQAEAIANRVKRNHAHIVAKPSDIRVWWNERQWDTELAATLDPLIADFAARVSRSSARTVRAPAKADSFIERVVAIVRRAAGSRIAGINQTTRDAVARLVEAGIAQGLSPGELAQHIREAGTFSEARAELISRTESATAYNEAALHTYGALEVERVQAIDGDTDDECARRNGQIFPLDEAMGISDHPNGTLDWVPVV